MFNRDLLDIIVCPLTSQPLEYDPCREELISRQAGVAYPICDGMPILLISRARRLDADEESRVADIGAHDTETE